MTIEENIKAEIVKNEKTDKFKVDGMTCAACSAAIERKLKKTEGVSEIAVNLATGYANICYDPEVIRLSEIKSHIKKLGYDPLEADDEESIDLQAQKEEQEVRALKQKLWLSIIFSIPLLYVAMGPMINLPWPDFLHPMKHGLRYAFLQILLTIPVIYAGRHFYKSGFKHLFGGAPNMDSLIAIGTSAALLYSIYSTYQIYLGDHMAADHLYFETAAVIIALILLGKTLENISKKNTSSAIKSLVALTPKTALVLVDNNVLELPIKEIQKGDIILVKPGSSFPVDGEVISGTSLADESSLTGESEPIPKNIGDKVFAASINVSGALEIKAEKVGSETTLAKIIKLVEDAQGSKAPISRLADTISGIFVPIVIAISIISAIGWYIATKDFEFSLKILISVLVIACPCALGLATPTAIMVGTGRGASLGILIKSGEALETSYKIKTILFDKTGTLTKGKPEVTDFISYAEQSEDLLIYDKKLIASAEALSNHPQAKAIVTYLNQTTISPSTFTEIAGQGIKAYFDKEILIGNLKLMLENGIDTSIAVKDIERISDEAKTPILVAISGKLQYLIATSDVLKENSKKAIENLNTLGIETIMLTGDNTKTAGAIANKLGIQKVIAEVLPQDKEEIVKQYKQKSVVAMVGDGINDSPALVRADVGIAIGSGTDVAIDSADIVLIKSDILDVAMAIALSKATITNIKQNLFWAFIYNTLGIPIAAGVLYIFGGPLLTPMFGALAMSLSSVSVVLNALRLRNFKI